MVIDALGLMLNCGGFPYRDVNVRVESAWSSINFYEVLILDSRVMQLIKRIIARSVPNQTRNLCMKNIDLVEKRKDLLKVVEEFKDLPGYEGTEGGRSKRSDSILDGLSMDLSTSIAVQRSWEEDPFTMSEEVMKMIALQVMRERLLDHQHFITSKLSQCKILVGKNGSKIRIGLLFYFSLLFESPPTCPYPSRVRQCMLWIHSFFPLSFSINIKQIKM
ncbi:GTP-binding protein ERG [Glycine soja]